MLTPPLALTSRAVYVPNRPVDSRARAWSRERLPRCIGVSRRPPRDARCRCRAAHESASAGPRDSRARARPALACAARARAFAGASASPCARFSPGARAPSVTFARRGLAAVAPETRARPAAVGNGATDIAFADLALCAETLRALHEVKGFERATAVQGQTLPHILGGADVLAREDWLGQDHRVFAPRAREARRRADRPAGGPDLRVDFVPHARARDADPG